MSYLRSLLAGLTLGLTVLFGLLFILAGFGFLAIELLHPPTHTTHVFLFTGLAVLGTVTVVVV